MFKKRHSCFPLIASIYTLLSAPLTYADPYEVLVVATARLDDVEKIDKYEKDARQFNTLHRKGYLTAKPYFDDCRKKYHHLTLKTAIL